VAVLTYRVPLSTVDGNFAALVETDVTAASRTDGWTSAKLAAAQMAEFDVGVKQASGTFSATAKPASLITSAAANAFKTPSPLTGDFANAAWTFTFALRCSVSSSQRGRMRMRVFKSKNADGSSATELTSSTQIGTTVAAALSTSADQTSVVTWSPGAVITLDNEYLFFVIAWEVTTAGGSNTADVLIRTGQAAGGSRFATADFSPKPSVTTLIDDFNRADGKIAVGAGALLWYPDLIEPNSIYDLDIISGQIAGATFQPNARSKFIFDADFDFLFDCVVAGTTTGTNTRVNVRVCMDEAGSTQNCYEIRWQADGVIQPVRVTGGSNTMLTAGSSPAPVAGETVWVSRRGNTFRLYKGTGGIYTQVHTWTDSNYMRAGPMQFMGGADSTYRWDNFRGGPFYVFPSTNVVDDFNRPDQQPPGGRWAGNWNVDGFRIVSNQLRGSAGSWDGMYWDEIQASADQEAYVTFAKLNSGPFQFHLRRSQVADTAYVISFANNFIDVIRRVASADTSVGTSFPLALNVGDSLGVKIVGNKITVFYRRVGKPVWAYLTSFTDSAIAAGDFVGLYSLDVSGNESLVDNFGTSGSTAGPSISGADSVATSDVFSSVWDATFTPADSVAVSDDGGSFAQDLVLNIADTVTTSDSYSQAMDYALLGAAFGLAETVTTSDALTPAMDMVLDDPADTVAPFESLVLADFTPAVIPGLALWLDATTLTSGAAVNSWPQAGGASPAGALSGSPAPVVTAPEFGINGRQVVRFTRNQGSIFNNGGAGFDRDFTVIYVARMWGANKSRILSAYLPGAGAPNVLVGWWNNGGSAPQEDMLYVGGWCVGPTGPAAGTLPKLYSADCTSAGTARLFSNGSLVGSAAASASGFKNTYEISPSGGANESSDCDVGEVVIYNRKLADVERQQVEDYFRTKWMTAGAALTINATDSVSVSDDGGSFVANLSISAADSVATSEAPTISLDIALAPTDSVTPSDGSQFDTVIPLDLADSVTVTDLALIAKPDDRPQFSFAFSYAYELAGVIGGGYSPESGGGARTTVISKTGGGIEVSAAGEHAVIITDWTLTPADSVTTSDSYSQVAALGIDDPLDSVATSDADTWVENYAPTFTDSVALSDDASGLSLDISRSFADTVTTSDLADLVYVIPKSGGAVEGSFTGLSKLTKVAQSGGGIEQAVGGAVWAFNASKSGGGIEGASGGGSVVKAFLVTKSGGATSAEVGDGHANLTSLVAKSGGAVEGSVGGILPTTRLISESGGGISAESGAFMVGTVKVGGAQSPESGGISKIVTAAKTGQGTEEEIGGGAVSTLVLIKKTGGAVEGSVGGGTESLTLIVAKAGGATEPQTAGAARATFLVKSAGGISAETASGHQTILALFVKSGGGISHEYGSGYRSMLVTAIKAGGGIEIQVSGGQRQSIHRLVGGGEVSETGGGSQGLLLARSGGATSAEIGGLARQTFYAKRFGGISPERGGGYGRRIKTFQEGGAESPEKGGGKLNYTIAIPPGEGQEGELVGSIFGATLVGASNDSSTGQLVGATSGAMVLSGIEKAILVAAQEEVTFE
jgi:hypothetical protein